MNTPVAKDGMKKYDNLPSVEALVRAWSQAGANDEWHAKSKRIVREAMPTLAFHLDRLVYEEKIKNVNLTS